MPALRNVSNEATRRAWLEVDVGALRANCRALAACLPGGCRLLPMVKADGYGIGMALAVEALSPLDPWGFGVATTAEGLQLRALGWTGNVLVCTPGLPEDATELSRGRLQAVVPGLEALLDCQRASIAGGGELQIHLEVDTGMGRFGFGWEDVRQWAPGVRAVLDGGRIGLVGTLTHFHSADTDAEATRGQWERFAGALTALRAAGVDPGIVHTSNSAAAMLYPELRADLVRPGIYLYGGGCWQPAPRPVVSVRARVLEVRQVPAGTTVSYGATYTTPSPARLATLGIGYGDGLRRELSNAGRALIGGEEAPIRGVVCMDSTVVEVTGHRSVQRGDVATLLGSDHGAEIELETMAEMCGTISYEILTGWSARLPRIRVGEEAMRGSGERVRTSRETEAGPGA